MAIRENYNQDQTVITYEQTGRSTNTNELGMRDMQARVYERRNEKERLCGCPVVDAHHPACWLRPYRTGGLQERSLHTR